MAKLNKKNNQYSTEGSKSIPKDLKDQPFYGLELDEDQQAFRDAIYDPKKLIVICDARAGTGKTTISLGVANILVGYGLYNNIYYIMSPTQEQKQGYLPGNLEDKSAPYMEPLIEAMNTLSIPSKCLETEDNIEAMKNGDAYIKFRVHTYLRGCNFENSIIIIDEAENFYFDELKKTLTRIHDNCKVILIGHREQCDLYKNAEKSGFVPYIDAFSKIVNTDDRVAICQLTKNYRGWLSNFCDDVNAYGGFR